MPCNGTEREYFGFHPSLAQDIRPCLSKEEQLENLVTMKGKISDRHTVKFQIAASINTAPATCSYNFRIADFDGLQSDIAIALRWQDRRCMLCVTVQASEASQRGNFKCKIPHGWRRKFKKRSLAERCCIPSPQNLAHARNRTSARGVKIVFRSAQRNKETNVAAMTLPQAALFKAALLE